MTVLEHTFKRLKWDVKGITNNEEQINHFGFEDDIFITADDMAKIEIMLQELEIVYEKDGITIYFENIIFMMNLVSGRNRKIQGEIELLEKLKYLDSTK